MSSKLVTQDAQVNYSAIKLSNLDQAVKKQSRGLITFWTIPSSQLSLKNPGSIVGAIGSNGLRRKGAGEAERMGAQVN